MLNFLRIIGASLAAACTAIAPSAAHAQDTDSDSRAFLVTPLSFVKQTDLDFGQIIPTTTAGTVAMDSNGNVTTTGGVIQVDGTQEPALFWGYGSFNQTVLINIDQNTYTLTRQGGTDTMLLDQVTIGSAPPIIISTSPRRFRIANPNGFFAFTIAGRLQVAANQPGGVYESTITVTLEYE
ncbi:MAG: DUF4402 domain-containing protein [Pseudomonadota bacterium]